MYYVLCVTGIDRVGPIPTQTYAQAMTFENGTAYVVGGWGSESQCKVTRISVPEDLCELWSMSKYKCLQCKGCAFCSSEQYNGKSQIIGLFIRWYKIYVAATLVLKNICFYITYIILCHPFLLLLEFNVHLFFLRQK